MTWRYQHIWSLEEKWKSQHFNVEANVNGCDEKETEKLITKKYINHIEELGVNSRIIGIANNTKISYGAMQRLE